MHVGFSRSLQPGCKAHCGLNTVSVVEGLDTGGYRVRESIVICQGEGQEFGPLLSGLGRVTVHVRLVSVFQDTGVQDGTDGLNPRRLQGAWGESMQPCG